MSTNNPMGILSRERLRELLSVRSECCLSMYMATPAGENGQRRDRLRFRERLLQAEDQLVGSGLQRDRARAFLRPAAALHADDEFWSHSSDGLALFVALDWFRVFQIPCRFRDLIWIDSRFYIRPLLPLLQDDGRFYVLALTADDVHLYEATRHSIREVPLPVLAAAQAGLPERVPTNAGSPQQTGEPEAPESRSKADLLQFFRQVDEALRGIFDDLDTPLVLASQGYLAALYDSVNSHPQLLREKVPGNPNIWSLDELREQAWQMVAARFRKRREQAAASYRQLLGTGSASDDLRRIVQAAGEGRIATLFLERGRASGLNGDSGLLPAASRDRPWTEADDLLDYAVTQTLSRGGDVFDLGDVPTDAPLAAIFRD